MKRIIIEIIAMLIVMAFGAAALLMLGGEVDGSLATFVCVKLAGFGALGVTVVLCWLFNLLGLFRTLNKLTEGEEI